MMVRMIPIQPAGLIGWNWKRVEERCAGIDRHHHRRGIRRADRIENMRDGLDPVNVQVGAVKGVWIVHRIQRRAGEFSRGGMASHRFHHVARCGDAHESRRNRRGRVRRQIVDDVDVEARARIHVERWPDGRTVVRAGMDAVAADGRIGIADGQYVRLSGLTAGKQPAAGGASVGRGRRGDRCRRGNVRYNVIPCGLLRNHLQRRNRYIRVSIHLHSEIPLSGRKVGQQIHAIAPRQRRANGSAVRSHGRYRRTRNGNFICVPDAAYDRSRRGVDHLCRRLIGMGHGYCQPNCRNRYQKFMQRGFDSHKAILDLPWQSRAISATDRARD